LEVFTSAVKPVRRPTTSDFEDIRTPKHTKHIKQQQYKMTTNAHKRVYDLKLTNQEPLVRRITRNFSDGTQRQTIARDSQTHR
jgi:ribosomal protein S10